MQVFFSPSRATTIDVAVLREGRYVGEISGEDLTTLQRRYPDAALGDAETVIALRETRMKTAPHAISAEAYQAALNQLPPLDLSADMRGTSFKSSERLSGDITEIYAHERGSDRYWRFADQASLRHDAIMKRVAAQAGTSAVA